MRPSPLDDVLRIGLGATSGPLSVSAFWAATRLSAVFRMMNLQCPSAEDVGWRVRRSCGQGIGPSRDPHDTEAPCARRGVFVLFGLALVRANTNVGFVLTVSGAMVAVLALAGHRTPSDSARGRKMA